MLPAAALVAYGLVDASIADDPNKSSGSGDGGGGGGCGGCGGCGG